MAKLNVSATVSLVLSQLAVILSGLALLFSTGTIDTGRPVSPEFEAQARTYLLENPEVLVESFRRLEERQRVVQADDLKTLIRDRHDEIFNDPEAPIGGNPEGDVTLVEFFDYNCPYCRKAAPIVAEAAEADEGLRIVYKEFPILGPGSDFAARAALAAHRQGKYEPFHQALMAHSGAVDKTSTLEIAAEVGLDVEQLKRDVEDPAIAAAIGRNLALARDLRITGTPSFVAGDEIVRGLVDLTAMQGLIGDARKPSEG